MLVLAPLLSVVVVLLLSPLQVASQSLANSGACPATSGLARDVGQTQTLGAGEAAYIDRRTKVVQQAWLDKLSALNLSSDAVTAMIQKDPPRIALAMSGGGLTATLFNTGYLQGLDARNATAQARGTAGLLDLFSYIAGLSGGSWALGTLALNDWPTVQSLHDNVWQLQDGGLPAVPPRLSAADLVSPLVAALNQAGQLLSGVLAPGLSVVNVWGTLLAGHFVATSSPFTAQWSDISSTPSFQNASKPFPLVTAIDYQGAALRPAGGNATIVEFNPYEFGSWDPAIAAFANISVMGTPLTSGNAPQDGQCILGYATAGYVMGLSSAIFNSYAQGAFSTFINNLDIPSQVRGLVAVLTNTLPSIPNPFKGFNNNQDDRLTLVDGGEDGQVIPLAPLIQPVRHVDMVLTLDSLREGTNGWPAGYSIYATYLRYSSLAGQFGSAVKMPAVPAGADFVGQGLNTRPTFFGCSDTDSPIVIYVANYPWSTLSNFTSDQFQYDQATSQLGLDNGVEAATLGGLTAGTDISWPTCLACAAMQRALERTKTARPKRCDTCMKLYCWDGETSSSDTSAAYSPSVGPPQWVLDNAKTTAATQGSGGGAQGGGADGAVHLKLPHALALASIFVATLTLV